METTAGGRHSDAKIMALIGVAHFLSHFYQLALPPLFPILNAALGLSYTRLGLLVTVFYIASGLCQTPAGFLVDRFGARRVLLGGVGLLAAASSLYGVVQGYPLMMALAVAAGVGNSVFHPADLSILSGNVTAARVGRAYGVHALGGYLGYGAAPAAMVTLAGLFDWRAALVLGGLFGLAVLVVLGIGTRGLGAAAPRRGGTRMPGASLAGVFLQPAILLCFGYFALAAMAQIGTQSFAPTTLHALYGKAIPIANAALSGLFLGAPVGVIAGGVLADRWHRHDLVAACGMAVAAVLFCVIALLDLPDTPLIALFATIGLSVGLTMPSRDMIVRGVAPAGASGRVFGFVYSGLDLGSALTPVAFGALVDGGAPRWVLLSIALLYAAAIVTALAVRARAPARAPAPAAGE